MLLIRARGQRTIVQRVPAESLIAREVQAQAQRLASQFPPDRYEVDVSQVGYARDALGG